jgi:hypothetical protein
MAGEIYGFSYLKNKCCLMHSFIPHSFENKKGVTGNKFSKNILHTSSSGGAK